MKLKLIALDLDGTTLNKKGQLTIRTVNALKNAVKSGIHVVIATGRTFSSLPKEVLELEGLEYVITSNGAHITELKNNRRIYSNYIAPQAIEKVVAVLRNIECSISIEAFVDGVAYMDKKEYDEVVNHGSAYRDVNYIINTRIPVNSLFDFMFEYINQIENININFEFFEDKNIVGKILKRINNITLTSSFIHNWEIGGETTSKGEALSHLMKIIEIDKSQMIAFGDSPNDITMIKLAEVGIALGNATDEVKEEADLITETNDNDGVAMVIEKYLE